MDIKKLKISLLLANLNGGGAERMMVNLAKGFSQRDIETELVLCDASGPYLSEVPEIVKIIDLKSPRVLFSVNKIAKYLKVNKPDVLISTLSRVNISAILAKRISRVSTKIILREANTFTVYSNSAKGIWDKAINYFTKVLYPKGDEIVAVSEGVAEDLRTNLKLLKEKVHVIYNPVVDDDIFRMAEEDVDHPWLRNKEIPVVIAVGRVSEQKDFVTLVKAFNEAQTKKDLRLLILGNYKQEDPEFIKLKNSIEKYKIDEKVEFTGFVNNPFAYLSRASVFVLSSRWEGLPGVLIQALACGCPVVSTDCPSGPSEIINSPGIGFLSPIGDYKSLAHNILKTLNTKINKEVLINRAREFSVDKAAGNYLKLISGHE